MLFPSASPGRNDRGRWAVTSVRPAQKSDEVQYLQNSDGKWIEVRDRPRPKIMGSHVDKTTTQDYNKSVCGTSRGT